MECIVNKEGCQAKSDSESNVSPLENLWSGSDMFCISYYFRLEVNE